MIELGSKVICIDDSIPAENFLKICEHYPNWVKQKPKPYTVRAFLVDPAGARVGILLEEIVNPLRDDILKGIMIEPAFNLNRFRLALPDEVEQMEEPSFQPEELVGVW